MRGRYRLTAAGFVGVLVGPGVRFVLRPKIPRANLHLLLDPDAPPDDSSDQSTPEPGSDALNFLAGRLADTLNCQVRAGLSRGYVERADHQAYLQGRLDLAAQLRDPAALRDRFHVVRDDFTTDRPIHRLPKAIAERILHSPHLSPTTRARLRAALNGYADVSAIMPDRSALEAVADPDRPLVDLCQMIVNGLQPGEASGSMSTPGFLIDLGWVFERYVERTVRAAVPDVAAQTAFRYHGPVPPDQPDLIGRPDAVVRQAGRAVCAIDAKWKQLAGPPPAADVHQALAYAVGLGCRDVRLVYPGRRSIAWRYDLSESGVRLTVHTLRVVGRKVACERSARRFGRELRDFAGFSL
jgi:5-methylcytosine-specific restriction enzyme subunit McrC